MSDIFNWSTYNDAIFSLYASVLQDILHMTDDIADVLLHVCYFFASSLWRQVMNSDLINYTSPMTFFVVTYAWSQA